MSYPNMAAVMCRLGATDEDLAEAFGVAVSTLNGWRKRHAGFAEALRAGKGVADEAVERSLFERATGFVHEEVHVSTYQGQVTLTPVRKQYAPEVSAAVFWLKNRRPERWREKAEAAGGGVREGLEGVMERIRGRQITND
ncbi:terminase [Luteolibacter sp. Populi]|uniref:terminase n=1 Tax=Luteolibacter sp. Populi TaxID=3230487 RepID=UPI0034674DBD